MLPKCVLAIDGIDRWVVAHEIPRGGSAVIGRKSACDIQLKNLQVSSRHARVFARDGAWWIEDLGSSNHTYVNGERVDAPTRLANDDLVLIKPHQIAVRLGPAPEDEMTLSGASVEGDSPESDQGKAAEKRGDAGAHIERATRRLEDLSQSLRLKAQAMLGTDAPMLRQAIDALEEARRTGRRLQYLARMHRALLFTRGEPEAFQAMLNIAQRALKAEVAFLMFINPRSKAWEVKCKSPGFEDLTAASAAGGARSPISLSLVSKAVADKQATLSDDLPPSSFQGNSSIVVNRIATGVAAPLFERDQVVGCFYADRRSADAADRPFTPAEAEDAKCLAQAFVDAACHFVAQRVWERQAAESG